MTYLHPSIAADKDREIEALRERLARRGTSEPELRRAALTIEELGHQLEEVLLKYNQLLYAVASKYPGETRHETALRYIQEREYGKCDRAEAGKET